MPNYVEPRTSRFRRETVDGIEQIRIPTKKNWFVVIFVPFWLVMWAIGLTVAGGAFVQGGDPFLAVWLTMWLLGGLFALLIVADQFAGFEVVRTVGRDLELSSGVGPLRRRKLYRGDHIRNLRTSDGPNIFQMFQMPMPSLLKQRWGAVKFDYGAETVHFGGNATEAEGRMIIDLLTPKLPRSVVEGS